MGGAGGDRDGGSWGRMMEECRGRHQDSREESRTGAEFGELSRGL